MSFLPFGRHFYDPNRSSTIPAINMEVWPGLVSSLRPYEDNLLLMMDTSHKMLRLDSVYDVLYNLYSAGGPDFKAKAEAQILGQTVITR